MKPLEKRVDIMEERLRIAEQGLEQLQAIETDKITRKQIQEHHEEEASAGIL